MASTTFYYFFSIFLVILLASHIVHMFYYKSKKITFLGERFKVDTPEYKKVKKMSSPAGIAIASALLLIFVVNLVSAVNKVSQLENSDAKILLIFAPIAILALFFGALLTTRSRFGKR